MIGVTALTIAGCTTSPPPSVGPAPPVEQSSELREVTLYLAGMNKELKIL